MSCLDDTEQQVVHLVNQYRASHNRLPLRTSAILGVAADRHALDLAAQGFLDHTGSDGSTPWQRIKAAGYPANVTMAENVAAGYRDAASVVQGWIDSPGHRANLLSPNLTEVGIALAVSRSGRAYWAQVFGGGRTDPARLCGTPVPEQTPVPPPAIPPPVMLQPRPRLEPPRRDSLARRIRDEVYRRLGLR